jgi:hypothetical protein
MPEYVLQGRGEADRWERTAQEEVAAAERASGIAKRDVLFTIIFASVLFFAGVSGKFAWRAIDLTVLGLGALTLLAGLVLASPRV